MAENKKPNGVKLSPWWISGVIIAMFIILNIASGSTMKDPTIISSSKLDELINSGNVTKIIVFNKVQAEVYLTADALKDPINKKISKDVFGNPNKGPHFTSEIADAQNFENKLIKAAQEKKIKPAKIKKKKILLFKKKTRLVRNVDGLLAFSFTDWGLDFHHEKNVGRRRRCRWTNFQHWKIESQTI
jgi:hypothetical protein